MRGDLKWHGKRTRIKGHEEEGSAALKKLDLADVVDNLRLT